MERLVEVSKYDGIKEGDIGTIGVFHGFFQNEDDAYAIVEFKDGHVINAWTNKIRFIKPHELFNPKNKEQ